MRLNAINIVLVLSLLFFACGNEWDKHYKDPQGDMEVSGLGVWEYLQSNPEYSEFVGLMKEIQADTIFAYSRRYTVWALKNGAVPDLSGLTDSVKSLVMWNHFSLMDYSQAGFEDGLSVTALSGKRLRLHASAEGGSGFLINSSSIVKTVMRCTDGIIHEIDRYLPLQPMIYEHLFRPEYSLLKEIVDSYNILVFDEKNSTEIGKDFEGNIVYDSAFMVANSVLSYGPINRDGAYFTAFLTRNEELQSEIDTYYRNMQLVNGYTARKEDTLRLNNWIVGSFIHYGLVEDYGEAEKLGSVRGTLWRTSFQKIVPGTRWEYSNGYVYEMEDLYVPATLVQKNMAADVVPVFEMDNSVVSAHVSGSYTNEDATVTNSIVKFGTVECCQSAMELKEGAMEEVPPFDYSISWETARLDSSGAIQPLCVCPGEYSVQISFVKTPDANQDFAVYINDKYAGDVKMSSVVQMNVLQNLTVGRVNIPRSDGVGPVKVTLKHLGTSWKRALVVYSIGLKPTINYY